MLLEPAPRTVRGARDLLSVALQYGNAFGQGFQAAALKPADFFGNDDVLYLMEDMATGEIRLSILWEWLHKGAPLTEADAATGVARGRRASRAALFERLLERGVRQAAGAPATATSTTTRRTTTLPIAREIVETYVADAGQAALVHRPAEHQPRQPRPRRRPGGGSRSTWTRSRRTARASPRTSTSTRSHRQMQLESTEGASMTIRAARSPTRSAVVRRARASRASRGSTRRARWSSSAARSRTTTPWRARRPRRSTRGCASCSPQRKSDHDVRSLLAGPGRGDEADGHRGHLPRRLGDLGQGLGHRGSRARPGELSAEPGARRGRAASCARC